MTIVKDQGSRIKGTEKDKDKDKDNIYKRQDTTCLRQLEL